MNDTCDLAQQLIREPSVTPNDANCQKIISEKLTSLGFQIHHYPFGDVNNLWAIRDQGSPCFVFAGHTDVVPPGDEKAWSHPPFSATIDDGRLYGRGAADMKSSIAAMITAIEQFLSKHNHFTGSIALLITSDEEGDAINGTVKVVEKLLHDGTPVDYCLVGEATCANTFGDTIKVGRRGSLTGKIQVHGKQGHIAYPALADNPIHRALPALSAISELSFDKGNAHFQPSSLQFADVQSGVGASNVIPGELSATFNVRYSPETTAEKIKQCVEETLRSHQVPHSIQWRHGSKPFYSEPRKLAEAMQHAVAKVTQQHAELSTSGGTSDGRFLIELGCEVIEFGPCNESIHQVEESIGVEELALLSRCYGELLEGIFAP